MNRGKNPTYNQLNETIEYLGEYYINLNKNDFSELKNKSIYYSNFIISSLNLINNKVSKKIKGIIRKCLK